MTGKQPTKVLPPIGRSRSLTLDAYHHIKAFILSNELLPGQQLKEEWLAAQLNISPTPLREALAKLEQEKLVNFVPHRGKFVAEITAKEVEDIYEVRRELEGLAVALAMPSICPQQLAELTRAFERAKSEIDQGNYTAYYQTDTRLHELIHQNIANQWLLSMLAGLNDHVRRIRAFSLAHSGPHITRSLEEHFAILEAMQAGNAAAAQAMMEQHVQQAGQRIVAIVKQVTGESSPA
jgi:DNA-binding GntR family transcriptional regulator